MPDNFIQQPENTQNYNRYAYVLNNPLMYNDPSGEIGVFLAIGIGALVAATTYTMTALLADVPFSVGGLLKSTFIGAASAAVTFGIGSAAGNMFTGWVSSSWQQVARGAFQAMAHGTFQGGMTAISGGKFWSGFAAGALSSIASSAFSFDGNGSAKGLGWASSVRDSGAGMIAFGTVSGGAGAALTGGNFWQGAVTGLFVSGLNHSFHDNEIDPPGKKNTIRKLTNEELDSFKTELGMGIFEWVEGGGLLKGGEKIYEVYQLVNKETKVVEYIGKTSQGMMKRFEQHLLDPTKQAWINNVEIELVKGNLTKVGAKYYEQTEILRHGLVKLHNRINAVAEKYWIKYGIKK